MSGHGSPWRDQACHTVARGSSCAHRTHPVARRQPGVDRPRGENMCCRTVTAAADHAGVLAEAAAGQLDVAGGQRGRPAVHDLADPGEELLVRFGEVAADDDDRGVEEVDRRRPGPRPMRRPASRTSAHGAVVAGSTRRYHVAGVGRRRARPRGREAARAAPPATASRHPALPQRHSTSSAAATWMWPMSPAAPCAPRWMAPSTMRPQPMPVPDLDEQQVVHRRSPARPVLTQGHDVHVVVDQDGDAGEPLRRSRCGIGYAVPAGHDRRADHPPGGELDRARQTDADPFDLGRGAADAVEQGRSKQSSTIAEARRRGRRRCRDRPPPRSRRSRPGR